MPIYLNFADYGLVSDETSNVFKELHNPGVTHRLLESTSVIHAVLKLYPLKEIPCHQRKLASSTTMHAGSAQKVMSSGGSLLTRFI